MRGCLVKLSGAMKWCVGVLNGQVKGLRDNGRKAGAQLCGGRAPWKGMVERPDNVQIFEFSACRAGSQALLFVLAPEGRSRCYRWTYAQWAE